MTTLQPSDAVTLHEYQETHGVTLTSAQARALASFRFQAVNAPGATAMRVVDVSPASGPGTYNLRANSIVGSVAVAGLDVNILPKSGVGRTAQMLAYSMGLARFLRDDSAFADARSLSALLVPAFLGRTSILIGQGLVEDYVPIVETGTQPRGRIDFTALARTGLPSPLEYGYDDFVADTPHNRLVARGLHAVTDMRLISPSLHAEARRLLASLTDVAFIDSPALFAGGWLPDRTRHYRDSLTLASLILRGAGIEPKPSTRRVRGLLFDMNRVFEDFVTAIVRSQVTDGLSVDAQGAAHPMHLDTRQRLRLRPDFAVWDRFGCQLVGDVKYKIMDAKKGPRRPDIYQIVNYAVAAGSDRALLIYAGNGSGTDIEVVFPHVNIEVRALDDDRPIAQNEADVRSMLRP